MAVVSSLHFLLGPVVALCAMGIITLLCRWVFSTDHRPLSRTAAVDAPRDLGLLVPVAEVRTRADAEMLVALLREAGVRASVSTDALTSQVLVFASDEERARRLVATP